jgi:hypothetical protein
MSLIILAMKGGMNDMVAVYVALIVNHRRTITQVPVHLQDEVMDDLTALGLDGNGNQL